MSQTQFQEFLRNIDKDPIRLLDEQFKSSDYIPIDLSTNNKQLQDIDVSSSEALDAYIFGYIKENDASIGYGGYNEIRGIYDRAENFKAEEGEEKRNIHLGMDIWAEAETKIYAPLEGRVHSYRNNGEFGDYGPTIILEHKMEEFVFYTLYGHLSLDSMEKMFVGKKIKQGKKIGKLGDSSVNGDYPPHLHFQIIRNIENYQGDYPGVCSQKNLEFYLDNCPDPNLLLKL